jgi:DNA modification methylase
MSTPQKDRDKATEYRKAAMGADRQNFNINDMQKSLCNIPHRFAISMTDHKWIQRNTIIWHKPSCMPSSAKDRFTVDFEYVFLFARSRKYYFEQQFEPYAESTLTETGYNGQALKDYESAMAQNPSDTKRRVINSIDTTKGRNRRCVWRTNSASYKGAHFAVFPEKLVEPMILAGCPSAICDSCGVPFETITNGPSLSNRPRSDVRKTSQGAHGKVGHKINEWRKDNPLTARVKKCDCGSDTHAGIVLDPFVGSGTTALVARKLGRHYIGIDLNPNYCDMANKRLAEVL